MPRYAIFGNGAQVEQSSPAIEESDLSALCTRCGLCCDGLFARVALTPDDLPLARRAGEILQRDDGPHAPLPCAFLEGHVCSVYEERYAACRRFRCKLLRSYAEGKVDVDTALARIGTMRARLDEVKLAAKSGGWAGPSQAFYDSARATITGDDPSERHVEARARLAIMVFNLYADKYFRNVADPKGLS